MSGGEHTVSIFFLFFCSLLTVVLLLSQALHSKPRLNSFLSEPALVLLIGVFCSFCLSSFLFSDEDLEQDDDGQKRIVDDEGRFVNIYLSFPSKVFFMALLPPILFNSGYQLERELFYRHFTPIAMFSTLGTVISGFAAGFALYGVKMLGWFGDFDPSLMELLTFGALIAATDTVSVLGVLQAKKVDPHLFSLVFGESALNDAVAIVLFRSLSDVLVEGVDDAMSLMVEVKRFLLNFTMEAIGSPLLGTVFAFCMALVFRKLDFRRTKEIELSIFVLTIYIPFIIAELSHLSGIVAIFFTGISARRYIEPNVTDETKQNAEAIFKLVAYLSETCIFLELGLSIFGLSGSLRWSFVLCSFAAALFGRAMSTYPLSMIFNFSLKKPVSDPLLELDDLSVGSDSSSVSSGTVGSTIASIFWPKSRKTPEKRKDKKIPFKFMHILWFAGLRGAVAYACAREFPNNFGHTDEIVAATTFIVLVTVILMGGLTDSLLDCLGIRTNVDQEEYMKEWRDQRRLTGVFHELEYKYMFKHVVKQDRRRRASISAWNRVVLDGENISSKSDNTDSSSGSSELQKTTEVELAARV